MDFFTWFLRSLVNPYFWIQPVFYAFHGWLATEMALWMLFHPYEPKYVPGTRIQLPLTPGIFPRGRHKLSIAIANTITDILLTQKDIKRQAEKLITEDNLYKAYDMIISSVGNELRDINHIRRIYRYVENLLPVLVEKLGNDYIVSLENESDQKRFNQFLNQLFNQAIPHVRLNQEQAAAVSRLVFEMAVTPHSVRHTLIHALTDDNIAVLEDAIRSRVGGVQGILMKFLDLQKGFQQFRQFLTNEPEEAEAFLADLMDRMNMQGKLADYLARFSLQTLPVESLEELKRYLTDMSRTFLVSHRETVVKSLSGLTTETTQSITSSMLQLDYHQLAEQWLPGLKRDLARFTYTYLHKELENMLSVALPAISLNTVIIEKIDQFSAQELEETIQSICHRELRWLAFLGAFLGFWLGLLSNLIAYQWHL